MSNKERNLLNTYYKLKTDLSNYMNQSKELKSNIKETKISYREIVRQIVNLELQSDINPELLKIREEYIARKNNIRAEVYNAISHGLGVLFGIVILVMLLMKSNSQIETIAYAIYASSFILLFLASTLYHSLSFTRVKKTFRKIDHSSIFILIAGTYTPYLLITLSNLGGIYYFIGIWSIAILGILLKAFYFDISVKIGPILYVLMGWLSVFMIKDLYSSIDFNALVLLVLGGLSYTGGVYFYKKKSMRYSHLIWHIFVLMGAIFMFMSIYLYV